MCVDMYRHASCFWLACFLWFVDEDLPMHHFTWLCSCPYTCAYTCPYTCLYASPFNRSCACLSAYVFAHIHVYVDGRVRST